MILILLILLPFILIGRVEGILKSGINDSINAKADFEDIDLTIIKSFPDFTVEVKSFSVVGIDAFEGDTLASVRSFELKMDFWTVVGGDNLIIKSVKIVEPTINVRINEEGLSSADIFKPKEEEEEESQLAMELLEFIIEEGTFTYLDEQSGTSLDVLGINHLASGKYSEKESSYSTELSIREINYGNFPSYTVKLISDATYYSDSALVDFEENSLSINSLDLYWDGKLQFFENGDLAIDMDLGSGEETFKDLLSLVSSEQLTQLEGIEANGLIDVGGHVHGIYNESTVPAFSFNIDVSDGSLKYVDLPNTIDQINISMLAQNPGGSPNGTEINIPTASLRFGDNPISLSGYLNNFVDNPLATNFDFHLLADMDLGELGTYIPLEDNTLSGLAKFQFDASGVAQDLVFKQYDKIEFAGSLEAEEVRFYSSDMAEEVYLPRAEMSLDPEKIELTELKAEIAGSDVDMQGTANNWMLYMAGIQELEGSMVMNSSYLNADELLAISERLSSEEVEIEETDSVQTVIMVPPKVSMKFDAGIDKLIYDGLEIDNISTEILMADEAIELRDMQADLLGGNWTINGRYDTKEMEELPKFDFSYDINTFDIPQAFSYLNSMDKIAPIAAYMAGIFSSDLSMSGKLNPDFSLDPMSLTGGGKVEIPFASITGMPVMEKIAELTQLVDFKELALTNAWTVLNFENGRVYVEPTDIKMKDFNINLMGSNGFDYSIDYLFRIDVPTEKLGPAKSIAEQLLAKNPIPNFDISAPEIISFNLDVKGTVTKPEIKLLPMTLGGDDQSIRDLIVDELKEQGNAIKDSIITDAQDLGNETKEQLEDAAGNALEDLVTGGTDSLDLGNDLKGIGDSLKNTFKNKGFGGFSWPPKK